MNYRLTFLADSWVNWCPALGTVLANDEIKDGVSERGGHPVQQKLMRQWSMRISAYAERLLTGLEKLDWSDSIKDQQRNWIGKSVGASVSFDLDGFNDKIEVFTTRPDTIYGVSFMVLAPEHDLVAKITTDDCRAKVDAYIEASSLKSERDRQADVKNITGEFTGAYAVHPFTGEKIPVWIGDYVLASYGTGAVMSVPCGDQRDYDFAKHFDIEIKNIFEGIDISEQAYAEKNAVIANSDFLNGLPYKEAMPKAIAEIEAKGFGKGKTNYRLRDAVFSRQRYWGEPFPVYYKGDTPYLVDDENLPVELPEVDAYLPTEDGEPPLARAKNEAWNHFEGDRMEFNTMPGWAGSSWYFLRYLDPTNDNEFVAKDKVDYWGNVDLYIGGSEHATGHLLYSRFWTKFLNDIDLIPFDEPFQKMINQGMILGKSSFVYRVDWYASLKNMAEIIEEHGEENAGEIIPDLIEEIYRECPPVFISKSLLNRLNKGKIDSSEICKKIKNLDRINEFLKEKGGELLLNTALRFTRIHADINFVDGNVLDTEAFKNWREEYKNAEFILEDDGTYICGSEVEKMSKSKFNVQTPDELVEKYGADTLRCYEMFLGPLEQSKPWDTQGISGVSNFLRKYWRLFYNEAGEFTVTEGKADDKAMKTLHKTIKKVQEDLNRFSFNTSVSNFMIAVNELTEQKCNNKHVLEQLTILMSSYAPYICEEIWEKLGHEPASISKAAFPKFEESYLVENSFAYPVSFNGKMRFKLELPTNLSKEEIEKEVLANEQSQKYIEGKELTKIIVVPNRIVNIVVKG
jgi:leucyl-tRNA synthetase